MPLRRPTSGLEGGRRRGAEGDTGDGAAGSLRPELFEALHQDQQGHHILRLATAREAARRR